MKQYSSQGLKWYPDNLVTYQSGYMLILGTTGTRLIPGRWTYVPANAYTMAMIHTILNKIFVIK